MKSFTSICSKFTRHHFCLLIIIISVIPIYTTGQNTYFNNDPIWTIHSACAVNSPSCIENKNYNYYINGDTSFNGHAYKKLFTKGTDWFMWFNTPPPPPYCQGSSIFNDTMNAYAYVRDSSSKIYFATSPSYVDNLLYDFNLSIGDTLPLTFNNGNTDITVVAIDSIQVSTFYPKRFHLSSNSQSQYLIEGIGHDGGFFEPFPPIFDCSYYLTCYGLGDTSYYPINGASCNMNVGIEEFTNSKNVLSLYPNPSNSFINIKSRYNILEIKIYNSMLQAVYDSRNIESKELKVDIHNFIAGIYFIQIKSNSFPYSIVKKIVKL